MGFQIMNLIGNWLNSKGLYRLVSRVTKGEWWGPLPEFPTAPGRFLLCHLRSFGVRFRHFGCESVRDAGCGGVGGAETGAAGGGK